MNGKKSKSLRRAVYGSEHSSRERGTKLADNARRIYQRLKQGKEV